MLPLLQGSVEVPDGQYLPEPSEAEDRRTPAERRYDEMMAKRAAEKTKKMAMKSHRWAVPLSDVLSTRSDTADRCCTGQLCRWLVQLGPHSGYMTAMSSAQLQNMRQCNQLGIGIS